MTTVEQVLSYGSSVSHSIYSEPLQQGHFLKSEYILVLFAAHLPTAHIENAQKSNFNFRWQEYTTPIPLSSNNIN